MRYGNEWPIIRTAVDICPTSPIAWLLQTDLYIACEDPKSARESLASAEVALQAATDVDEVSKGQLTHYASAWRQWLNGDLIESAKSFERVLQAHPHDVYALKRAQLLYFLGGSPQHMQRVGFLSSRVLHCIVVISQ